MVSKMAKEKYLNKRVRYLKKNGRYGWEGTVVTCNHWDILVAYDNGISQTYSRDSLTEVDDRNPYKYLLVFEPEVDKQIVGELLSVAVVFNSGGRYNYLINTNDTEQQFIQPGDKVIVDTPKSGYETAKVVELYGNKHPQAVKYVVSTINDYVYTELVKKEKKRKLAKKIADLSLELESL